MKGKKKSNITYQEEIYPSELTLFAGPLFVFAGWIPSIWVPMPVLSLAWIGDGRIVALSHQSLQ
jgi:hypothetical protein